MFHRFIGFALQGRHPWPSLFSAPQAVRRNCCRPFLEILEQRLNLDLTNGLVVHLTFDGDVVDHSGHHNDGTIVRPGVDSPYIPAIIRQGFQTVGLPAGPGIATNNFITLGSPADLNFTDTDFSFSWWGKFQPSPTQDEIAWLANKDWTSGGLTGWVLASGDTPQPGQFKWNFRARGDRRHDSPLVGAGLDDNQWHHYVVTFARQGDGVTYLDGTQIDVTPLNSSGTLQSTFAYPTNIFQDGTGDYTDSGVLSYWDQASIADLGIWRRTLSADETTTIYQAGLNGQSAFDLPPGGSASAPPGKIAPLMLGDPVPAVPSIIGRVTATLGSTPSSGSLTEVGTRSAGTNTGTEQAAPPAGASIVTDRQARVTESVVENLHSRARSQVADPAFYRAPKAQAVDALFADTV